MLQMEAPALGGHRPCMWAARRPGALGRSARTATSRAPPSSAPLGLAGGANCRPPGAAWWVYGRVRHPEAVLGTASSERPRGTAWPGPVPTAVLPARPPAAFRGRLGPRDANTNPTWRPVLHVQMLKVIYISQALAPMRRAGRSAAHAASHGLECSWRPRLPIPLRRAAAGGVAAQRRGCNLLTPPRVRQEAPNPKGGFRGRSPREILEE